ncbi:MAG: DUF433 domain-containing protein [Pirellulales bacterium]|jgi:uncharacterized protein (DUF433 family)
MDSTIPGHIEATPGTCGGVPRIAGTRIRVQDVVLWTEQGLSPDEIVSGYPHLTLADVHAALAYYYDHREQIDRQMSEADALVRQMESKYGSRSRDTKADGGSVPS